MAYKTDSGDQNNKMQADNQTVIKVENVSKSFRIPTDKSSELKTSLLNTLLGKSSGYRDFQALKDISFSVNDGDFFGIVGRNGSGKSTLLKILSQIYVPSGGKVHVRGSLMPFIELGVGFNPKLSARDNVYLNGAMIGFSRKEVDAIYDEIVDFAELHDFMEEKLKNFSSGMKVRLAFSIAIRAPSDILLLDEVIAVGDKSFRDKCNEFFKSQKGKRTIVLVTHDMSAVEEFCNRAMLIDDGKVVKVGDSDEIANLYNDMFTKEKSGRIHGANTSISQSDDYDFKLKSISTKQEGKTKELLEAGKDFSIQIDYDAPRDYKNVVAGIKILNSQGLSLTTASLRQTGKTYSFKKGVNRVVFKVQNVFTDGDYHINITAKDVDNDDYLLYQQAEAYRFSINGTQWFKSSLIHPKIDIKMETVDSSS